jgi:hypothetical protein
MVSVVPKQPIENIVTVLNIIEKRETPSTVQGKYPYIDVKISYFSNELPTLEKLINYTSEDLELKKILGKTPSHLSNLEFKFNSIADVFCFLKLAQVLKLKRDNITRDFQNFQLCEIIIRHHDFTLKITEYDFDIEYKNAPVRDELFLTLLSYQTKMSINSISNF